MISSTDKSLNIIEIHESTLKHLDFFEKILLEELLVRKRAVIVKDATR